jgi:hypothetical protein
MVASMWSMTVMRYTLAIAKYSATTDVMFMPKLTKIAISVDMPSMEAMNKGPMSLQIKSIRLICALTTLLTISKRDKMACINSPRSTAGSPSATTTTCIADEHPFKSQIMFSLPNPSRQTPGSWWRKVFQRMPGAPEAPVDLSSSHEQVADRWQGCRR